MSMSMSMSAPSGLPPGLRPGHHHSMMGGRPHEPGRGAVDLENQNHNAWGPNTNSGGGALGGGGAGVQGGDQSGPVDDFDEQICPLRVTNKPTILRATK